MKLSNIHADINDDLELSVVVTEGILDDLMHSGLTKLQSWLAGVGSKLPPKVQKVVDQAKTLKVSLVSDERAAVEWWNELFDAFGIGNEHRKKLHEKLVANIKPRIDLTQEDSESRLQDAEGERANRKKKGGAFSHVAKQMLSKKDDGAKPTKKPVPAGGDEEEEQP